MMLREFFAMMNRKCKVRQSRVMELKKYYLSMVRANLLLMYDKGYIKDPTAKLDLVELRRNIAEMDIVGMVDSTGCVEMSVRQVEYAICKNKKASQEVQEFLALLKEVKTYSDFAEILDDIYDSGLLAEKIKRDVFFNTYVSGSKILTRSLFPVSEPLLACMYEGCSFKKYSPKEEIWKSAMAVLGIEGGESAGLFDKDLTHEEEVEFSDILLEGKVPLNGSKSNVLLKWLESAKWSEDSHYTFQKVGLYTYVLEADVDGALAFWTSFVNKVAEDCETTGAIPVGMVRDGVYVSTPETEMLMPIGAFAFKVDDENTVLPLRTSFEGYLGEACPLGYLRDNNIRYVGCPFELYDNMKYGSLFVDIHQTELIFSKSFFLEDEMSFGFLQESNYKEGVFPQDSLEDRIYKIYCDFEIGNPIGVLKLDFSPRDLTNAKIKVIRYLEKNSQ